MAQAKKTTTTASTAKKTPAKKTTATARTKKPASTVASDKKRIAELEKIVADLIKSQQQPQIQSQVKFDISDDINVTSLCSNKLNLSTKGNGNGEIYTFEEFGEVQGIPFGDLKDIVRNNKSFFKAGYFYIEDENVLKKLNLSKINKGLPSKDTVLNLFKKDSKTFIDVFTKMPKRQQETFAILIVDRIVYDESIDFNIVQECGSILNRDLMEEAKLKKQILPKGE